MQFDHPGGSVIQCMKGFDVLCSTTGHIPTQFYEFHDNYDWSSWKFVREELPFEFYASKYKISYKTFKRFKVGHWKYTVETNLFTSSGFNMEKYTCALL